MTYRRVIPRDLFNEGSLLTCLGKLWIRLEGRDNARLVHHDEDGAFVVHQDPSDGSIRCCSVTLFIRDGLPVRLFRPLNSRDPWPLWAHDEVAEDDLRVFEEEGDGVLSAEFLALIGGTAPVADEGYPPPCTDPAGHYFPPVEEHERSLCANCGADGDA
jgi:hypothetical protein